jgi:hypothetical protein
VANIPKVWNGTAFIELEAAATVAPAASTTVVGIVQLTDSTSSSSTTTAATPNSVKSAYDLAGTAIPKNTVTAAGDILYASGSATVARLAVGTASQVLGIAAGVPAWTTPSGGGITCIGTVIASAGTAVSFTGIPTTYKHLVVRWQEVSQAPDASQYIGVRFNNDSGTSYQTSGFSWLGSTFSLSAQAPATEAWFASASSAAIGRSYDTSERTKARGLFTIYDYADTSIKRMAHCQAVASTNVATSSSGIDQWCIYTPTGTAITQIDFIRSGSQTITGNFYLYGVS